MKAKKKIIGGREYMVIGSQIDYGKGGVVRKSYATFYGNVVVKNGMVFHPDGDKTPE